jgi:MoaA/NifB/PqqE/SkfB family radical SAM enzyme
MRSEWHKKLLAVRNWLKRYPLWLAWQVTYRCNFRCRFCGYWQQPALVDRTEATLDEFRVGSDKLAEIGSLLISLAGGEPTLRADLVDIVRIVSRQHIPFITTNGWLVTPHLAAELWDAGLWGVSISLDYADPDRHDEQRGVAGAFDRAVAAIRHFRDAPNRGRQRVNVMTVLAHDNLDQVEPLLELAAREGANLMVQPYCPQKTGDASLCHAGGGVGEHLLELRRRYPNFLSNPYFLSRFDEALDGGVPGCMAGEAFVNVDQKGDVAICVERRHRAVGNLMRDPAWQILRKLRAAARSNRCRDCWYNCRGEIEQMYHPVGWLRSMPVILTTGNRPPRKP